MRVLIFGASGMVGHGVLRECLLSGDVTSVVTIGRTAVDQTHVKLRQIVRSDLYHYRDIEADLAGFDACLFCLGASASGMNEAEYRHITFDLTLAAAHKLAKMNPSMTFVYLSGAGADGTGKGKVMWARVRGQTENALRVLPFKAVYIFRPGIIQPLHGARSKTPAYRVFYTLLFPVLPLARLFFPKYVLTTAIVGRAMLNVVRRGAPQSVLEAPDIYAAARS